MLNLFIYWLNFARPRILFQNALMSDCERPHTYCHCPRSKYPTLQCQTPVLWYPLQYTCQRLKLNLLITSTILVYSKLCVSHCPFFRVEPERGPEPPSKFRLRLHYKRSAPDGYIKNLPNLPSFFCFSKEENYIFCSFSYKILLTEKPSHSSPLIEFFSLSFFDQNFAKVSSSTSQIIIYVYVFFFISVRHV